MASSILAELSYEAALRVLDLQERAVEELRGRTGMLLAASSLTAAFLGAQTIAHSDGLGVLGGLARQETVVERRCRDNSRRR